MAEKILMIALSPTMEEGTIVKWIKKEGDALATGDLLCEVETDKATMEYECQNEGTLLKILVPEGGQASVAEPIAIAGEKGEDVSSLVAEAKKEAASADAQASAEPAQAAPAAQTPAAQAPAAPAAAAVGADGGRVKSSPLARKIAADRGIEIAQVRGTGPGGRVVKRDVESMQPGAAGTAASSLALAAPLEDRTIPVSGKRKVIAQRLAQSKFQAPHYYLKVSFEMDGMMEARTRLNARRKEGKISFNAFIHKLAAEALKRHPMVNAGWEGELIRMYGSIDIGLAVAVPDGLITPVVRNCGAKGIVQIDQELNALIAKARDGKLTPEEYTGATFTISNLGTFGIEEFTAIINPPGSAILALGKIQKTPIVGDDDELRIRQLMKASLSCDHRVVDGALGAAFLADLKEMIENPYSTLY
jgi:pyruvate dehydrogenase E2 component (dihydrolipoamide acetyltransferase)